MMANETYKTSFVFPLAIRPKITKLQSILEEKTNTSVTKAEVVEKAIDFYLSEVEKWKKKK